MSCKAYAFILIIILMLFSFVYANDESDIVAFVTESGDTEGFSQIYSKIRNNEFSLDPKSLINSCVELFTDEVKNIFKIFKYMMIVVFLNAFLTNFNISFISKGTNNAVYLSCYCVFIILTSKAFADAGEICVSLITKVVCFLQAAVPVSISLIASIGSVPSGTLLKPVYLFFLGFISSFCMNFILPVINAFFALNTIGCMSNRFSVRNLSELLKKVIKWTMVGTVTLFIGSVSVVGVITDKVVFKGAKGVKFLLGNFVPVVGRMLSDTVETVAASAVLIKNSVGVSGIILIALICVPPLIKLLAIAFTYKICSAIIEPICDLRLSNTLSVLSSSVELMLGICLTVGIIFAISLSVLINIGG